MKRRHKDVMACHKMPFSACVAAEFSGTFQQCVFNTRCGDCDTFH